MITARRPVRLLLAGVALAIPIAGCSKSTSSTGGTAKVDIPASQFKSHTGHASVAVDVVDNDYVDPFIIVSSGTKVTWTNDGRNDHSVSPVKSGSFVGVPTTQFNPGQSHSATFDTPGDYPYYCSIHGTASLSGQAGVVRVVAKGT